METHPNRRLLVNRKFILNQFPTGFVSMASSPFLANRISSLSVFSPMPTHSLPAPLSRSIIFFLSMRNTIEKPLDGPIMTLQCYPNYIIYNRQVIDYDSRAFPPAITGYQERNQDHSLNSKKKKKKKNCTSMDYGKHRSNIHEQLST